MIELGKVQKLKVVKITDFGVYLGTSVDEKVLLPKKQVPEGTKLDDVMEVFIYKDSSDRLIATTGIPIIKVGEVDRLTIKELTKIGAFADWGLEKDLFIPFREQTCEVTVGKSYLVALYIDKSERLAGTMRVYNYMQTTDQYKEGEEVAGTVYEIKELGAFVAVDNKYFGLIPKKEVHSNVKVGDVIKSRITKVRPDGKLDLSAVKPAYLQMGDDVEKIVDILTEMGGTLPYNDKAPAEIIDRDFSMSKSAFKRAIGRLYKERRVAINEDSIVLLTK